MPSNLRRVLTASATALVVATLLTACGGSDAASTASSSAPASASATASATSPESTASGSPIGPNPCEVLTNDEIAAILGSDPGAGVRDTDPSGCTWAGGLAMSVAPASPTVDAQLLMTNAGAPGVQELEGVGENAAYADFKDKGIVLLVAQQAGMQVGIYATTDVQKASALAQAVLDKVAPA